MSEIKISRAHSLSLERARQVAEGLAERLKEDSGLDWAWKRNVLHFERPGVTGELHVTSDEVRLHAKLGLLLGFLKPRIEKEIGEQFDKYFRPAPAKKAATKKPAGKKAAGRHPSRG